MAPAFPLGLAGWGRNECGEGGSASMHAYLAAAAAKAGNWGVVCEKAVPACCCTRLAIAGAGRAVLPRAPLHRHRHGERWRAL